MTELKPFQERGVRWIYHFRGRALLADEQGLGKTIQALEWVRRIPKRRPVVIVCPASMKYTWRAEAAMHFGMRTEVLEGFFVRRRRKYRLPGDILIINYDILKSWLPVLLKADPQVIILDEVHYLRNPGSIRTQAVGLLAEGAASVLGLSGTPFTNRPVELWPVMAVVRPDVFPDFKQFAWRYCRPKLTKWGWIYRGATRTGELNEILRDTCMIRRTKQQVLPELPDKIRKVVSFRLGSYREYRQAEDNFLAWLKKKSPLRAHRAKKAEAMAKVGYLLRLTARLKLEWTEEWISDFFEAAPGRKLVAFTMNTFVIEHLKEKFKGRAVVIDGSVTGRKREESVRRFQNHPKVDLLLGNWRAAGVGLTLHAAYNAAALDLPWTPGDLVQGEDRIHRIGQTKKVIVHYLMAQGTIEEKLMRNLLRQSRILESILDGESSPVQLDIFDSLLKGMQ